MKYSIIINGRGEESFETSNIGTCAKDRILQSDNSIVLIPHFYSTPMGRVSKYLINTATFDQDSNTLQGETVSLNTAKPDDITLDFTSNTATFKEGGTWDIRAVAIDNVSYDLYNNNRKSALTKELDNLESTGMILMSSIVVDIGKYYDKQGGKALDKWIWSDSEKNSAVTVSQESQSFESVYTLYDMKRDVTASVVGGLQQEYDFKTANHRVKELSNEMRSFAKYEIHRRSLHFLLTQGTRFTQNGWQHISVIAGDLYTFQKMYRCQGEEDTQGILEGKLSSDNTVAVSVDNISNTNNTIIELALEFRRKTIQKEHLIHSVYNHKFLSVGDYWKNKKRFAEKYRNL